MGDARAVRGLGEDHSKADFGNHRLERRPLVGIIVAAMLLTIGLVVGIGFTMLI
jgi:hypothetical protein